MPVANRKPAVALVPVSIRLTPEAAQRLKERGGPEGVTGVLRDLVDRFLTEEASAKRAGTAIVPVALPAPSAAPGGPSDAEIRRLIERVETFTAAVQIKDQRHVKAIEAVAHRQDELIVLVTQMAAFLLPSVRDASALERFKNRSAT